jgi:peptidoglycan hydrolase CwlO-like protein
MRNKIIAQDMRRTIFLPLLAILILTACGETKTRKEINRRKAALVEKQETELKKAQAELWKTDSLLQLTNQKFDSLTKEVELHKQALKATPEELTALTQLRIKRDSIRTQYEALGLKIRYIHKKQKEK